MRCNPGEQGLNSSQHGGMKEGEKMIKLEPQRIRVVSRETFLAKGQQVQRPGEHGGMHAVRGVRAWSLCGC